MKGRRGATRDRPRRALIVGRFQPPHRGHVALLEAARAVADELIVVVGSAQRSHTMSNPLTVGERLEAIDALARDTGMDLAWVVPVVDLDQYHLWVAHVEAHVPDFDVVVAASPMTLELFKQAGYEVHKVEPVNREAWSGTRIRQRLLAGEEVSDPLTPGVTALLGREKIRDRMRAIAAQKEGITG